MRGTNLLQSVELAVGLGMLLWFVALLLVPGLVAFLHELPWLLGGIRVPLFGVNPHYIAGANVSPPVVVLCACLGLAACYRLLAARRRD